MIYPNITDVKFIKVTFPNFFVIFKAGMKKNCAKAKVTPVVKNA
jgi:hypothetical protein